jgi:serine/threonine protein kinase
LPEHRFFLLPSLFFTSFLVLAIFSVSKSSDVFGLGCTIYFAMTGRLPFDGPTELAMIPLIVAGKHTPITGEAYTEALKTLVYSLIDRVCL